MKLRQLFGIHMILAWMAGLAWAIFPDWAYRIYDLSPAWVPVWSIRLAGGFILVIAVLLWYGSRTQLPRVSHALALFLFILSSVLVVLSILVRILGIMDPLVWINALVYGLLALGYAWFLWIQPARIKGN